MTEYAYNDARLVASVVRKDVAETIASVSAAYDKNRHTNTFTWDGLALIQRGDEHFLNEPHVGGGDPVASSKGTTYFNDMLGTTVGSKSNGKYSAAALSAFGERLDNVDSTSTAIRSLGEGWFTGKPQVAGLGHAFLMRNYRAGLGKWQTADPMGYPDGWNQLAYCRNGVTGSVDLWGCDSYGYYYYNNGYYYYSQDANYFVGGEVKTEINSLTDALAHYRSGAGNGGMDAIPAGAGLYAEMKNDSTYVEGLVGNNSRVAEAIKSQLVNVNKTVASDSFERTSFVGALDCATLGDYRLNYTCTVNWRATDWVYDATAKNYYRYVTAPVTVTFSGTDTWDFTWNASYNLWQNVTRELIPGWIAGARGNPAPFRISFSTTEIYGLVVKQYE